MRISDWSSAVCSSYLWAFLQPPPPAGGEAVTIAVELIASPAEPPAEPPAAAPTTPTQDEAGPAAPPPADAAPAATRPAGPPAPESPAAPPARQPDVAGKHTAARVDTRGRRIRQKNKHKYK